MWPRQILELGKQFNLMIRLQNILKASLQDVLKMSSRRFCRLLEDALKTSWRRLEDVLARRIYWSRSRRLEDALKTSSEDEWLRWIYSPWSRCLQDVFIKTNVCWEVTWTPRFCFSSNLIGQPNAIASLFS